ncbi:zf-HC2 domain-containing protein [Streptomyces purpureus]|uniref:anti-sigma factor family protein n=1 Tax=Streptomyces purpureus TaxID=1951 RepID=UPI00378D9700
MSGISPTPAEHHLGDRLAALVDGELGHDARERVLAHLATCAKCKAEADAQRRLKSVFAQAAPPPPSEGLLARLHMLPGGPGTGGEDDRGGPFGSGRFTDGVFGVRTDGSGYVPAPTPPTPAAAVLPSGAVPGSGFRIHEVGRPGQERSLWRGRRFAFAAASAVSFAAIALGGALPMEAAVDTKARGEKGGNRVSPLRAAPGSTTGTATAAGTQIERRRGSGNGPARSADRPAAVTPAAPVRPGLPTPPVGQPVQQFAATAASPLVRPTGPALQLAFLPGVSPMVTPAPTHLATPTQADGPLTTRR